MLIGLDLPEIISGLDGVSIMSAIGYGVLITAVLIVGRILSAYGAVIVTFIAKYFITVADPRNPGLRVPFALGWTGMRGVVSLAAALSIPVQLSNGHPFPQRNLILFITFIVILLTLLIQGLTLPYILRKIKLPDFGDHLPEEEAENMIRKELAEQALFHLRSAYSEQLRDQPGLRQMETKWASHTKSDNNEQMARDSKPIYLDILNHQRLWLINKNKDQMIDEEVIRRHLTELDLEEERMRFI